MFSIFSISTSPSLSLSLSLFAVCLRASYISYWWDVKPNGLSIMYFCYNIFYKHAIDQCAHIWKKKRRRRNCICCSVLCHVKQKQKITKKKCFIEFKNLNWESKVIFHSIKQRETDRYNKGSSRDTLRKKDIILFKIQ